MLRSLLFVLIFLNLKDSVICVQDKLDLSAQIESETVVQLEPESSSCGCHNLKRDAVVDIVRETSASGNPAVKYSKLTNEAPTDSQTRGKKENTYSQVCTGVTVCTCRAVSLLCCNRPRLCWLVKKSFIFQQIFILALAV